MNKILSALNYIDDELIYCALECININKRKSVVKQKQIKQPKESSLPKGGVKVKVVAFSVLSLALCAVIVISAVFLWKGNYAVDQRAHGEQKILNSISEVSDYYPDGQMFDRLASLSYINYYDEGLQLFYDYNTDWQNSENWNSLLLFGTAGNSEKFAIIYCLFEDSFSYWNKARPVYKDNSQTITIGGTQVQVAYLTEQFGQTNSYKSFAIFEYNNIVYELCINNDTTNEIQTAILESLLTK